MQRNLPLFIISLVSVLILNNCTKSQLKKTQISLTSPTESAVYHYLDTVFIEGLVTYKDDPNNIGFFIAMVNDANDSTFMQRSIFPLVNNYKVNEYYRNMFDNPTNVTVFYGKRHKKSQQIYELKEIKLTFLP